MIRDIESGRIGTVLTLGTKKCTAKMEFSKLMQGYDEFEPIPLSEEWLLKMGFQKEDEGSVFVQFHYGENPVIKDYLISLMWIKDYKSHNKTLKGFPFYRNGHFRITSVHQLQNLVHSLTGEELTIKN